MSKYDDIDFLTFFIIWANIQKWEVPELHYRVIEFLENYDDWKNNTAVLQIFRGAAKSTILALFIVYRLVKDPTTRFLVLSADGVTASNISQDADMIVRLHPLAKHLASVSNIWRRDTFWVEGSNDAKNASIRTKGIISNVTGGRADFAIFDDVEVPKNCETDGLRLKLRKAIGDTVHILVPGGKRLLIGTPHAHDSIYPEMIDAGASSLTIPVMSNVEGDFPFMKGDPVWPERFSVEEILKRQKDSVSKGNFYSQYLLIPYSPENEIFDLTLIKVYRNEANILQANKSTLLTIGNSRMVSVSAFWDPSLSKETSDDSILAVVFTDENGIYYIHSCTELKGDADQQCNKVKEIAQKYSLPRVIVETNGVGGFLPGLLRKHMSGTGTAVLGKHTTQSKKEKIIQAFEVRLAAGYLNAHEQVMQGPFMTQLRDFNPRTVGRVKDDYIDSVASAILNEPVRIAKGFAGERLNNWSGISTQLTYDEAQVEW